MAVNVIIQISLVALQLRAVVVDLDLHLVEAFLPHAGGLPARAALGGGQPGEVLPTERAVGGGTFDPPFHFLLFA